MSQIQAWIIVADRSNMERCAKSGVYGLNHGSQLPKMKEGDKLVAYLRKETTFAGIGEVVREYFLDDEPLFEGGLFPNRIGIRLEVMPAERSINVWSLIKELDFAKGKKQWQGVLAGGTVRLTLNDFQKIEERLSSQLVKQ